MPDAGNDVVTGTSRRLPVLAAATVVAGSVCVVASYATTSWFSFTGRGVVHGDDEGPRTGSVLIAVSGGATHHTVLAWFLVLGCVVAALAGLVGDRLIWSVLATVTGGFALVGVVARYFLVRFELPDDVADVHVGVKAGYWLALVGLVLVIAGAWSGRRGRGVGRGSPAASSSAELRALRRAQDRLAKYRSSFPGGSETGAGL